MDTRLLEIILAIDLLRRGVLWLSGIADMSAEYYEPMLLIMTDTTWGVVFTLVGIAQIAGVLINGNWKKSPNLRMCVLLFSIVAYTVLTQLFYGDTGAALQGSSQQLLNVLVCLWCLLNIAAKRSSDVRITG